MAYSISYGFIVEQLSRDLPEKKYIGYDGGAL